MPLVKKLIRLGDATGVILDPAILRQVDIQPDSDVEIVVEGKAIVIRSCRHANDTDVRTASGKVIRSRRRLLERLSK